MDFDRSIDHAFGFDGNHPVRFKIKLTPSVQQGREPVLPVFVLQKRPGLFAFGETSLEDFGVDIEKHGRSKASHFGPVRIANHDAAAGCEHCWPRFETSQDGGLVVAKRRFAVDGKKLGNRATEAVGEDGVSVGEFALRNSGKLTPNRRFSGSHHANENPHSTLTVDGEIIAPSKPAKPIASNAQC